MHKKKIGIFFLISSFIRMQSQLKLNNNRNKQINP